MIVTLNRTILLPVDDPFDLGLIKDAQFEIIKVVYTYAPFNWSILIRCSNGLLVKIQPDDFH